MFIVFYFYSVFAVDPDCQNDSNSIVIFSENDGVYQFLDDYGLCQPADGQTDLVFWLKARSDAKITLEDVKGNDDTIEITIGSDFDTKSSIAATHGGDAVVEVEGSWLDETEYRPFWMSWANGQVL